MDYTAMYTCTFVYNADGDVVNILQKQRARQETQKPENQAAEDQAASRCKEPAGRAAA